MLRRKLKYHPVFIRLTHWEHWPAYITNIPVVFFWLWQSVRARDLFFFTAINPAIETGGLFGESKKGINQRIPVQYLPKTVYIDRSQRNGEEILRSMQSIKVDFPVILKPDIGERGFNVALITSLDELKQYLRAVEGDLILQEYIDYKLEFSILCYDFPVSKECGITSVCRKEFLSVTGDGQSSLHTLIQRKSRARLHWNKLSRRADIDHIPGNNEVVTLEPIGNHCRGTKFLNANDLIDQQLIATLVSILRRMPGVHFGRFDLRTRSVEDLRSGQHFKILEFNGAGSEPAHIYDPTHGVINAYRDLWSQWSLMRRIAQEQRRQGVRSMSFLETIRALRTYFGYKRSARLALEKTP